MTASASQVRRTASAFTIGAAVVAAFPGGTFAGRMSAFLVLLSHETSWDWTNSEDKVNTFCVLPWERGNVKD